MKKILISFCCVLIFYNFTLNTFASVVSSDYKIQNEFDESIVLPVVYDNTSTYAMGGTIALGSLGLTTASGGAILGAAASVVAPILAVVGLVGGALVVGQGLINIYDLVKEYALPQDEGNYIPVPLPTIKKATGAVVIPFVPKTVPSGGGEPTPDPVDPKSSSYKKLVASLFGSLTLVQGSQSTNDVQSPSIGPSTNLKFNPGEFYYYTHSMLMLTSVYNDKFIMKCDGNNCVMTNSFQIKLANASSSSPYYQVTAPYRPSDDSNSFYYYSNDGGLTWTSTYSTSNAMTFKFSAVKGSSYAVESILGESGFAIYPNSMLDKFLNHESTQHPQYEISIDKNIIETLNPNVQFDSSTGNYVDKNMGTVINPSDLIVPMPDIMTDTSIEFSPEVEEVIMPNGPTTDPLPNPDTGTDTGGDSNTETPPSEDQDKGFLQSVKEFFLNLWDWLCNFWQNLLDLLMYLFNLFFGGLLDLLGLIVDTVTNILNFLYELPSHLLNLSQELFVPSSDFFPSKFQNVLTGLTNKVPLFGQIKDFFTNLNLGGEGTPPKITITLPEFFGGETYDFIDFRFFEQYRSYYLNIVRVFMWIFALKHIYRRLPSVISGGGYL